ncbi:RNA polymerase sigma-70 factor (ECF subfamily) [Chitinophaga niastensis]|uniref:RNA polymerase sigma-70 factor (ECF subfamily) n=1 Tax=Chitinophaga niastensis TaxID=536980 RepID=A0A2P8HJK8_CHINA|nr:sigma-70 family RNA polymerase sigma factor [Chitinophaga niastensis]PSL46385.1 RNA polymerase sigma-70 factor (ECF subfamily) [Chitinophaga niastensis]
MRQDNQEPNLLEQLKSGNTEVFTVVYTKYRQFLMILAEDMLKDENEAQDVLQEFFLDFWQKQLFLNVNSSFHNKDGSSTLRNYMYASIRNRCLNKIARDKKFSRVIPDEPQFPKDPFETKELYFRLDTALLRKVPPMSAKAFRLRYYDQKTHKEIAAEMETTIQTVKNQISKAVKILRHYFNPIL